MANDTRVITTGRPETLHGAPVVSTKLHPSMNRAFRSLVASRGRTASDVVRELIEAEVARAKEGPIA